MSHTDIVTNGRAAQDLSVFFDTFLSLLELPRFATLLVAAFVCWLPLPLGMFFLLDLLGATAPLLGGLWLAADDVDVVASPMANALRADFFPWEATKIEKTRRS